MALVYLAMIFFFNSWSLSEARNFDEAWKAPPSSHSLLGKCTEEPRPSCGLPCPPTTSQHKGPLPSWVARGSLLVHRLA